QIVMTAMTGKGAEAAKEKLADLIVRAVKKIMEKTEEGIRIDRGNIKIEKKKGEGIEDTELIDGIVIDKGRVHSDMPLQIKKARIALLDTALELKNPETDTRISVTSPEQLQAFLEQEEKMLKDMVEKIKATKANVVFCQKGIDDIAQYYLTKAKIFAVRRVKKEDMEKLAKATGAKIVSNLNDLTEQDLGYAEIVKEVKEGSEEEGMTYVMGCTNPKAVTILVRGGTEHVVEEFERAIRDGIGDVSVALEKGFIVAGGGAAEMEIAKRLREFAQSISGREQLAVGAFADALEVIPRTIAENAGMDPIDVLTELKSKHEKGEKYAGLDVSSSAKDAGEICNTLERGIVEPLEIKIQAIKSASEVAMMILRIDDVIAASKSATSTPPSEEEPPEY
ncbi:MAG: thermosome subunit, partial [Candidatus Pacearchaeota archaeon]|nr:thermosome subunit [Candidatus Pacearchaeota archaeon]